MRFMQQSVPKVAIDVNIGGVYSCARRYEHGRGGSSCDRRSEGVKVSTMLIANATKDVHDARTRHRVEMVERTRLRRLVERVDAAIEACEETHLQGIKEVTPELAEQAHKVFTFARRAVRLSGIEEARIALEETLARRQVKITEIMDMLWTIQEITFDLMLPWRTDLPEDVEDPNAESTAGIWRQFHAIA